VVELTRGNAAVGDEDFCGHHRKEDPDDEDFDWQPGGLSLGGRQDSQAAPRLLSE
jgi:hypothetical protein